jgi:hypothetical protein
MNAQNARTLERVRYAWNYYGSYRKNGRFAGDISTVGRVQIVSLSSCRNPAVLLSHPTRAEKILVAVFDRSVEDSKIVRSEQDV